MCVVCGGGGWGGVGGGTNRWVVVVDGHCDDQGVGRVDSLRGLSSSSLVEGAGEGHSVGRRGSHTNIDIILPAQPRTEGSKYT